MSSETVLVPLLNPNETEARLVSLLVKDGQKVGKGDPLGTLETTKSTFDLEAGKEGFVKGLKAKEGEMLRAGEIFCFLANSKDWKAPKKANRVDRQGIPAGLRITQPALKLAQEKGLPLTALPIGPVITEDQVRAMSGKTRKQADIIIPDDADKENSIIVYGGGGHGKAVIELIRAAGKYVPIGIVDDALEPGDFVLDVPVLGDGARTLPQLKKAGCNLAINAIGGIGAMSSRIQVFEILGNGGFVSPALAHPSAVVEPSAKIAPGVQIFPHAYVGSNAEIGEGAIINTGVIVSHDCELARYVNLSPGAILAGAVTVGEGTLIGMGVTINLNVHIGPRARVGNSATVKMDVPEGGIVRAGAVWPE